MKTRTVFIIGILFWICETWYFGWNKTPSCWAEKVCDFLALVIIFSAMVRMFIDEIAEEVVKRIKGDK